jgi:hypothetical protein
MNDDPPTPPDGTTSKGLLRNVNVASAKYYAAEVSESLQEIKWFSESGLLWNAAGEDARELGITTLEYLKELRVNFSNLFQSGKIHDREELIEQVDSAIKKKGGLALVVGGKNVGKSLVMVNRRDFFNSQPDGNGTLPLVLLVNGRETPDNLQLGLKRAFEGLVPRKWKLVDLVWNSVSKYVGQKASCINMDDVRDILAEEDIGMHAKEGKLLDLFEKLAEERGRTPCLVVDEANLFMGSDTDNDDKNGSESPSKKPTAPNNWEILVDLERRTKEKNSMAAILTSSEHVFPYKLSQAKKGLKLESVGKVVFAGEIPPKEMWDLLVTAKQDGNLIIGMGPKLAELCLDSYGGHVWYVSQAVDLLINKQDTFKADMGGPYLLYNKIAQCLENEERKSMLKTLAKRGFCSVGEYGNEQVKFLSEKDIGGLVNEAGIAIGLPGTAWNETQSKFGLVPTAQILRLMIATKLAYMEDN